MTGERIIGAITAAEAQKDNVQQLDAAIPLLSRRLLYEAPTPEDEIAGYGYLRGLTTHQDETVRDAAGSALEQRWRRVGFYELHTPSKRFPPFRENDRPFFHEAGWTSSSGSGVGDDSKVAILELARRREPMTTKQFEDVMTPLIGLQKDFPRLVDELKRLHVLNADAQYVPVAESMQARVRMTEGAYGVLAPHLPVLEAISYPEQRIAEEDKQLALAVGREVDRTLGRAAAFWTEGNIKGLTVPQERDFGMAMLGMLDFQLEEEKRGANRPKWQEDSISFVAEQGRLYTLSHADNPTSDWTEESVEVETYLQRRDQNQLLINFWGQKVGVRRERELGKLGVYKSERGANYIGASGVLTSVLPEGLQNASRARVSAEGMTISWEDVSGRGRDVDLDVYYQKSQKEPTPGRFGRGDTYVTGEPIHITVPETYESKLPRRRKKAGEDDLDLGFRGPRTTSKEIALDKDEDLAEVRHPKGRYTVAYRKAKNGIEITFTGRNWGRTMTIPSGVNPVEVVRSIGQQLEEVTQRVSDEREAIQQQVANIKHMGLVEHIYYSQFGFLPTPPASDHFQDEDYYKKLAGIDEGLASLDADTQYYAKYYMAVLSEMRRSRPIQEKTAREMNIEVKDPRQEFRALIRKHNINIPEGLLQLSEEVFVPEEYRETK